MNRSTINPCANWPVESVADPTITTFPSGWINQRPIEPGAPAIDGPCAIPPDPNEPSKAPEEVNRATSSVTLEPTPDSPTATVFPSAWTAVPSNRVPAPRLASLPN